jgi:cell division protein FtsL
LPSGRQREARVVRINVALAVVCLACALALVTSQHRARRLFTQLTKEQETTKQIEVEFGQLQLEQSTWAMHARIERVASGYLQMGVPPASRVQLVGQNGALLDRPPPVPEAPRKKR